MAEAAQAPRGLARLRSAMGGGPAGGAGHDATPANAASAGPAAGAVTAAAPAEHVDENGDSSGFYASTIGSSAMVRIESAADRSRAKFLEEVFFEYAAANKHIGQRQDPSLSSSTGSGSPPASPSGGMAPGSLSAAMFDEFLRGSGLKCSNMRQVHRLIEMMREAKRLGDEADEAVTEAPSEAADVFGV
jgi:hypothetical protein